MGIAVVGLGPGPYRALTLEAVEALNAASTLYLRTQHHPTVAELPSTLRWSSFDHLYEQGATFDAVYDQIVDELLARGATTAVTYAVPGHPLIGEATVQRLRARADAAGVPVRIVGGMSFVEAALAAGGGATVESLQLVDALAPPPLVPTAPVLVYQVYKPSVASDLKLALLRYYPPDHRVLVLRAAATPAEQVERLPLAALDRGVAYDHLTSVLVPPLLPDEDFGTLNGLAAIVARLRGPDGCPWDLKQTHESLKRYVLEEAYEVAEAIDEADWAGLCDELGDLLLQVALHARLADERGAFDLTDVLHAVNAKLVRRHPHVFGAVEVANAEEVEQNWEAIKHRERGGAPAASILDGLPRHHPALITAQALAKRLIAAGLDSAPREKLLGALQEAVAGLGRSEAGGAAPAYGELLLAVARLARRDGVDAEEALRARTREVVEAVKAREATGGLGAAGAGSPVV